MSASYAAKIYKRYGKDSIARVQENPYRLADDVWGIGFKTADSVAFNMGYQKNDLYRCQSGILYALNQLATEGHVYAEDEQLMKASLALLETEAPYIRQALQALAKSDEVIIDEGAVYLPYYYHAEVGVSRELQTLLLPLPGKLFADSEGTTQPDEEKGIVYDEVQQQAIAEALRSKVMVLTGGPGTGKTTTTQGIIAAFQQLGLKVLLAAPTGRAAKRMTEATGLEAKTLHRLLEYHPKEGYQRNEDNPLKGDVLIVDECSMIDLLLMFHLLKALPSSMRLVLVGDVDQ